MQLNIKYFFLIDLQLLISVDLASSNTKADYYRLIEGCWLSLVKCTVMFSVN